MKKKVDIVFVCLVYRLCDDIDDFVASVNKITTNYKIILVNSYFNDESLVSIQNKAIKYDCDFISILNKGYGYGNNIGIKYAYDNFDFKYIIISNIDIVINKLNIKELDSLGSCVIGPFIKNLKGKNQNPYWPIRNLSSEGLIYYGLKNEKKWALLLSQGINRVIREIFLLYSRIVLRRSFRVYALHGCFLIFPKAIIEEIGTMIFDEKMFLFYEEAYLANKLNLLSISRVLTKAVSITHSEDGSYYSHYVKHKI